MPLPVATVNPVAELVRGAAAAQVTPEAFVHWAVTELTGGLLQPVKFAEVVIPYTWKAAGLFVTVKLILVEVFVWVLSGVEEVKVMAAGVTLPLLTVKGPAPLFCAVSDRKTGVGRRETAAFCAHANPPPKRISCASAKTLSLRIPVSSPQPLM